MAFDCKHRNSFCFICGHFVAKRNCKKRSEKFLVWLRAYYGDEMDWIDENHVPSVSCASCYSSLDRWFKDKEKDFKYEHPMKWYDPGDHDPEMCYFCTNVKRHVNQRKSRSVEYRSTPYVDLPVLRNIAQPLHVDHVQPNVDMDIDVDIDAGIPVDAGMLVDADIPVGFEDVSDVTPSGSSYVPTGQGYIGMKLISQARLNNICRKLRLSQIQSRELTKMLREDNLLASDVTLRAQKNRQAAFRPYFTTDNNLTYCNNIAGLMRELKIEYDKEDWRLFIDGSKSALKAVLLHNDGAYMPVPIAYSRKLKESHASMKLIIDKIKYNEHKWEVSGDFKVIALILGLQLGRTRNACFICTWISTAKINHYHATWEERGEYKIGVMNIVQNALVPREKILLPTLHIKLGLISSFIKKLNKNSDAFKYLGEVLFPHLTAAKLNAGNIFCFLFCICIFISIVL